jgi:catechol 2,3-dioxygenase-like lactoylglutathione lyase family enzyme
MSLHLDHLILAVHDREKSISFYTNILGLTYEGERDIFSTLRVNPDLILQLAVWNTTGGQHLAFAMTGADFEQVFQRVRNAGIEYGDSFQTVGNQRGPGEADGAKGMGRAVYVFDPSKHLIEIRCYET